MVDSIDQTIKYLGKIEKFHLRKFCNIIRPDIAFINKLFLQWKQFKNNNKWLSLKKSKRVSFYFATQQEGKKLFFWLTNENGESIALKNNNNYRMWRGKIKYSNNKKGFGFLETLESINVGKFFIKKNSELHFWKEKLFSNKTLIIGETIKFQLREKKILKPTNIILIKKKKYCKKNEF